MCQRCRGYGARWLFSLFSISRAGALELESLLVSSLAHWCTYPILFFISDPTSDHGDSLWFSVIFSNAKALLLILLLLFIRFLEQCSWFWRCYSWSWCLLQLSGVWALRGKLYALTAAALCYRGLAWCGITTPSLPTNPIVFMLPTTRPWSIWSFCSRPTHLHLW